MELSFTQVPKPPPCEVFSYHATTYQGEQGAITHPSPQTPPCEVYSYLAITYQGEQGAITHPSPQTPTL